METQTNTHRFIKRTFDKFNDSNITELKWPAKFTNKFFSLTLEGRELCLTLRHLQMPTIDALVLDYIYHSTEWLFLRHGNMIINIDDRENITLQPTEADTDVRDGGNITERGYYSITKEQLKKICDAQKVAIKVSGQATYLIIDENTKRGTDISISPDAKFLFMCRAFYAGMYNDTTYEPALEKAIPVGQENKGTFSGPVKLLMFIGTVLPFVILYFGGVGPFAIYFVLYFLFLIGFLAIARMKKVKQMKMQAQ